jgi:transcriptional regulator with XRE-family HTH domain
VSTRSLGPAVARALLSAELKKLRVARKETQEAVARACEMSIAKFSRIENASSPPSKGDLLLVLRHYGVEESRIDDLAGLAREARSQGWWKRYDFGPEKAYEAYVGYEDGASTIRMSHPLVIPGLLQEPCYTKQMMKAWGHTDEDINQALRIREERRDRIAARGPQQSYILDEEIIRRPVGDVMEDQLLHLLTVGQKPAVTIRIVPLNRGPHFGLRGPFVLLGFQEGLEDVLYLESPSPRRGDLFIAEDRAQLGSPNAPKVEEPGEVVGEYQDGFDRLLKISLSPEDTRGFIERAIADLPRAA